MHSHGDPASSVRAREHWEEFYEGKRPWSGKPNAILVDEIGGITADGKTALDLGCGSGADAIWLAQQGWWVTAVDIADAALASGRGHAADAGLADDAITWRRSDLGAEFPDGSWDLVSAFYLHSTVALERADILRTAAAAVNPGGTLIVVGHWAMPSWRFDGDPPAFPSTDDVLADIGANHADSGWTTVAIGLRDVAMTTPDGEPCTRTDNVVHLHRDK